MQRRRILLALLVVGMVVVYNSDTVLFAVPESLAGHLNRKIAKRYKRNGIVAWWTFDGLAVEEKLSRRRSQNFGTVLTDGKYGKARAFRKDGETYIVTRVPWWSLGGKYTISTWVKLDSSSRDQSIVFNGTAVGSGIMLSGGKMILAVPHDAEQVAAYRFERYGEYVNITGVVDSRAKRAALYEDGVLKAAIEIRGVKQRSGDIEFGKYGVHRVYKGVDGALDETVVWGRALSPAEVWDIAQSGRSMEERRFDLAFGYAVSLAIVESVAAFADGVIKLVDHFNPLYHESRIYKSSLPVFNLWLSRNDVRYFRRFQKTTLDRGYVPQSAVRRRRVQLVGNDGVHDLEMMPYGNHPAFWANPKPAFALEGEALRTLEGTDRLVFIPPEIAGLLRPLLRARLARKYALPHHRGGLGVVRINGAFKGLYHFREHLVDGHPAAADTGELPGVFGRLPVPAEDLLTEYDALREEFEPLLVRDKRIVWSSRKVRYRIRRDRETLEPLASRARQRTAHEDVQMVKEYLTERAVLNGNPSASYVLDDLKLNALELPGIRITWASSNPEVISPGGRVLRPGGGAPVPVRLDASIARDPAVTSKSLEFTVMPDGRALPVLRLIMPGEVRNSHRTPCLVELIEDGGRKRTGWLRGAIKFRGNTTLRYPKKSYSLRLEARRRFFDFSDSKIVYLIAAYADWSLMRNKLAYDLYRSFGTDAARRYSPKVRLVEVFVNDEYHGIYQMSERVDRFLLNFERAREKDGRRSVIYKAQHSDAKFSRFAKQAYVQIEPNVRDGEYWAPLEDLIGFIGTSDTATFRDEIDARVNIENYIDFHILVNVLRNAEGIRYNLYLARGKGEKARFVIIPWDYDKSVFGKHEGWVNNYLFKRLAREVPGFWPEFARRWRELRATELSEQALLRRIDRIEEEIATSVEREFARWPRGGASHAQAVREMKEWMRNRLRFLDNLIEGR